MYRTGLLQLRRRMFHLFLPPHIAAFDHRHGCAGTCINDHALDGLIAYQCIIDHGLKRNVFGSAVCPIAGNDEFCLRIGQSIGNALRRESAKNHTVNGADTSTAQHRIGQFGNHAHVDANSIAFFNAVVAKDLGELTNAFV